MCESSLFFFFLSVLQVNFNEYLGKAGGSRKGEGDQNERQLFSEVSYCRALRSL